MHTFESRVRESNPPNPLCRRMHSLSANSARTARGEHMLIRSPPSQFEVPPDLPPSYSTYSVSRLQFINIERGIDSPMPW